MDIFEAIRDFMERGGTVLWVILLTTFALWCLIFERYIFFRKHYGELSEKYIAQWNKRSDHKSWASRRVREGLISQMNQQVSEFIPLIKTLVATCPLLGLLGTVTGMIAVFEVMAVTGTGNPRLMASGVSMATIPTMAGMVAALSGLYFGAQLERKARIAREQFAEKLTFDEEK